MFLAFLYNRVNQLHLLLHRTRKRRELFHNRLRVNDGDAFGQFALHLFRFGKMYDDFNRIVALNGSGPLSDIHIKTYAPATVMYSRLTMEFTYRDFLFRRAVYPRPDMEILPDTLAFRTVAYANHTIGKPSVPGGHLAILFRNHKYLL